MGQRPRAPAAPTAATELEPVRPSTSVPADRGEAQADAPGLVWVKDGVVYVRNPTGLGRWPTVSLAPEEPGIHLLINGEARTGEVVVQEGDRILLQVEREEVPGRIAIDVAEDGMSVWVTVYPGMRTAYLVPDSPPAPHFAIRPVRRQEEVPAPFTAADVRAALRAEGVFATPSDAAVLEALRTPGRRVLVATGRPPRRGRGSAVWTLLYGDLAGPLEPTLPLPLRTERTEVAIGMPVAKIGFSVGGEDGRTVRGEPVPAGPAWIPDLVAGPGTLLSADGRTAIAAVSGHLVIDVRAEELVVSVAPERKVPADIDAALGDVAFDGDIWVGGGIAPGRSVFATGHVEVWGQVSSARIQAGGSLRLSGAVDGSILVAGGPGLSYARVISLCQEMERALNRAGVETVVSLASRIQAELAAGGLRLHPEVQTLLERLGRATEVSPRPRDGWTPTSRQALGAVAAALTPAIARMRRTLERRGQCHAHALERTTVEASGDVVIGAGGAFQCVITALGEVRGTGPVRGGTVWAMRRATFGSLGRDNDLPTVVQLGPRARFLAAEILPGTAVLRGGTLLARFEAPAYDVVFESPTRGG